MTDDRSVVREIAWREVFPSVLLFSTWKVAINLRALAFAAVGIVATWIGWTTIDKLFGIRQESVLTANFASFDPVRSPSAIAEAKSSLEWISIPLQIAWADISSPFELVFSKDAALRDFVHALLCGLWSIAVWAFIGGAICRLAVVQFARDEKLSWNQMISYARSKWPSYFAAPLFPIMGALLAAIPVAVVGLLLRAGSVGVLIAALLWPFVLLAGVVMAVLLVGLLFNWPLMWATISAEGTDAFDALSRSYAYTSQRPLRYLGYLAVAGLVGVLSWLLVAVFAGGVLGLSQWAVSWGSGNLRLVEVLAQSTEADAGFGAWLIGLWNRLVVLFARGFVYSYFFSAIAAIYFLLRYHVDATELDEVYLPDEDEPYGLPPLKTDAAGVPQVADAGGDEANATNGSPEG